jgi:hypothetical protein
MKNWFKAVGVFCVGVAYLSMWAVWLAPRMDYNGHTDTFLYIPAFLIVGCVHGLAICVISMIKEYFDNVG